MRTPPAAADATDVPRRHAPRVPFALLVTVLVAGGLALLLALNTGSAANELRRHDLATQDAGIAARLQDLRQQVAADGAPGNLAAQARALGMVPAGNPAFLVVGPDGQVRVMGKPGAATEPPLPPPPAPKPSARALAAAKAAAAKKAAATKAAAKAAAAKKAGAHRSGGKQAPTGSPAPSGHRTSSAPATPSPRQSAPRSPKPASPTPTPTPVVTLPGGTR